MTVLSDEMGCLRLPPNLSGVAPGMRRRTLLPAMLGGCALTVLAGCGAGTAATVAGSTAARTTTATGCGLPAANAAADELPALTLNCLTGAGTVQLNRIAGQPVLVNLWASWCAPCREETPRIQAGIAATRAAGGIVPIVLGVDTKDQPAPARDFLGQEHVSWPVASDPDARLALALHLPGLPVTIGLDAAGKIVYRHIGVLTTADIPVAIRTVTQGSSPATAPPTGKATT